MNKKLKKIYHQVEIRIRLIKSDYIYVKIKELKQTNGNIKHVISSINDNDIRKEKYRENNDFLKLQLYRQNDHK